MKSIEKQWKPILKYPNFYLRCLSVKHTNRTMIAYTSDAAPQFWEDLIRSEHPRKYRKPKIVSDEL